MDFTSVAVLLLLLGTVVTFRGCKTLGAGLGGSGGRSILRSATRPTAGWMRPVAGLLLVEVMVLVMAEEVLGAAGGCGDGGGMMSGGGGWIGGKLLLPVAEEGGSDCCWTPWADDAEAGGCWADCWRRRNVVEAVAAASTARAVYTEGVYV